VKSLFIFWETDSLRQQRDDRAPQRFRGLDHAGAAEGLELDRSLPKIRREFWQKVVNSRFLASLTPLFQRRD
jgi:hypothetical protein